MFHWEKQSIKKKIKQLGNVASINVVIVHKLSFRVTLFSVLIIKIVYKNEEHSHNYWICSPYEI